jgi:hypothetical protein
MNADTKYQTQTSSKRLSFLVYLGLLLLVSNPSFANGDDDTEIAHLCKEGEEVVFSCMTGQKNISFCATPRYTEKKGSMTYRFGVAGLPPEMEYPSRPMPVGKAFRVSSLVIEDPRIHDNDVGIRLKKGSMYWREQAAHKFQKEHAVSLPYGAHTEIAFKKGAYVYTFFHQITNWIYDGRYDGAGLIVERAGREPFELLCNDPEQAVGGKGGDFRFFPRRLGYLNAQVHSKTDFEHEAQGFRGVSLLNRDRSIELQQPRNE